MIACHVRIILAPVIMIIWTKMKYPTDTRQVASVRNGVKQYVSTATMKTKLWFMSSIYKLCKNMNGLKLSVMSMFMSDKVMNKTT